MVLELSLRRMMSKKSKKKDGRRPHPENHQKHRESVLERVFVLSPPLNNNYITLKVNYSFSCMQRE